MLAVDLKEIAGLFLLFLIIFINEFNPSEGHNLSDHHQFIDCQKWQINWVFCIDLYNVYRFVEIYYFRLKLGW